jgi:hypothetical protein
MNLLEYLNHRAELIFDIMVAVSGGEYVELDDRVTFDCETYQELMNEVARG